MALLLRAGHGVLCAAILAMASPACFTAGNGTPPPMQSFYFPTGMTVSAGGNVLYAVNSDFDLQWNGGTLQSYDLYKIRQDAAALVQANLSRATTPPSGIPFVGTWIPDCLDTPPPAVGSGLGVQLQQGCSPPVDSTKYVRDSAIIGAFATALELSQSGSRIFAPVSGNATVTWADVAYDPPGGAPPSEAPGASFAPFAINCGARIDSRCASSNQTGDDPNSPQNTRNVTMPGEPFGMAQSQDGSVLAVTSETDTKTSLLTTGFGASAALDSQPTMQFVLDGLPTGGVGISHVPHSGTANLAASAVARCELLGDQAPCIRPAFIQTSRNTNEVDLLRYYDDNGESLTTSNQPSPRPFLVKERSWQITSNQGGSDFRGIAIDPTPRLACAAMPGADPVACGKLPARVFIASRTPPSLVVGAIGLPSGLMDGSYDPDAFVVKGMIDLPPGPSKVFLGPVVIPDGPGSSGAHYELRVFVVLFDSSAIAVINPNAPVPFQEALIPTGPGPFAMAFDPFSFEDVALQAPVPIDPRQPPGLALKVYRFAYVASFTHSFMQVIDLDDTLPRSDTFYQVVFNLGAPTIPKGQTQ